MKNQDCLKQSFLFVDALAVRKGVSTISSLLSVALLLVFVLASALSTQAQDVKYAPLKISSVVTQVSGSNTIVSIVADGSLRRAQAWQDNDGYHVIVPYATAQNSVKPLDGIRIRRVGQSLEILLQIEPGAGVSAQLDESGLRLLVSGELESRSESAIDTPKTGIDENYWQSSGQTRANDPSKSGLPSAADDSAFTSQFSNQSSASSSKAGPPALQPRPDLRLSQNQGSQPIAPKSEIELQPEQEGFFASIFSTTGVAIILILGIVGLLVSRKLRSSQGTSGKKEKRIHSEGEEQYPQNAVPEPEPQHTFEGEPASTAMATNRRSTGSHLTVSMPESLYGAYRIDQEVGKLVVGQPHRIDVLSSRAPEDRRAIEASLIKMIASSPDENERRRAAEALEEYGFVARECATLLTAPDPFDRTTAARSLGDIKSAAALPFLLEGLYDPESIVRNQVVASIGELKVPRAIGALLDIARRHPDVPGNLISQALSACSVEGLDFFDADISEPALLGDGRSQGFGFDITKLEPAASVEDLPDDSDDEVFASAILASNSEDSLERVEAAKILARFPVRQAVSVLTAAARADSEAAVRSQAISSLAAINHESVFPAVLIGMADESREVRAAAARSLTHLSFDRTDAYIRVLEMDDKDLLPDVARACIQAGIVSQGIDRLATGDKRQAYETFSIISLLARARLTEPVLDTICNHPDLDVRLATVRLLANTGEPEVFERLREVAVQESLTEELRTALLEAMYQLDHSINPAQAEQSPLEFIANDGGDFQTTPQPPSDFVTTTEFPQVHQSPEGEFQD